MRGARVIEEHHQRGVVQHSFYKHSSQTHTYIHSYHTHTHTHSCHTHTPTYTHVTHTPTYTHVTRTPTHTHVTHSSSPREPLSTHTRKEIDKNMDSSPWIDRYIPSFSPWIDA